MAISFEWGHPDDTGAGRHDGMTVSVWASDGTFVPGDDVDINGAEGVTLLDYASYDHVAEGTDGEIFPVEVTLDLSGANPGDEIFLRFNNYFPAPGADPWPVLDNVAIVFTDIRNDSPANNAVLIPVELSNPGNDLVFTILSPDIVKADVYLSANDANVPDMIVDDLMVGDVGHGEIQLTVDLQTVLTSDLEYNTDYYWKVIGYEPNDLNPADYFPIIGNASHFRTAPREPLITVNPIPYTAVDAGQQIVLTADGVNGTFQWYKDDNPIEGETAGTLTIDNIQQADEGYYTMKVLNDPLEDESTPARVMIHRQTSYYDFESTTSLPDDDVVFEDSIGGYHAVLMQDAASAGLPTTVTDTSSIPGLGGYVYIDNEDNAEDPNSQYLQIPTGVCDYEDITISFWAQSTATGVWTRLLDFGNGTASYMFIAPDIGGYNARFAIGGLNDEQQLTADLDSSNWIGPGTGWHFVAVTISGDTGKMYVDGRWHQTNAAMTYDPIDVDSVLNYIGKSQFAVDPYFSGYIDDLKIYNYARTNEQIGQDYIAVAGGDWICDWEGWNADPQMMDLDSDDDCDVDLVDFAAFAGRWLDDIYHFSL